MPSQYTNLYNWTLLNFLTNQNEDMNYPIKAFVQKRERPNKKNNLFNVKIKRQM